MAGKQLLIAVTAGADKYGHDKDVHYTLNELLRPFQATSRVIGMQYLKPFVVTGAFGISDTDLQQAGREYRQYLQQKDLPILGTYE